MDRPWARGREGDDVGEQWTPSSGRHHSSATDTDPVTVVHDLPQDPADSDPHRITWLAAYTVGLSFTQADDRDCVDQLLDVHPRREELRGAHGMLAAWDMVDTARHRRAMELLERALARAERDAPRWAAPREHRWVTEWSQ